MDIQLAPIKKCPLSKCCHGSFRVNWLRLRALLRISIVDGWHGDTSRMYYVGKDTKTAQCQKDYAKLRTTFITAAISFLDEQLIANKYCFDKHQIAVWSIN